MTTLALVPAPVAIPRNTPYVPALRLYLLRLYLLLTVLLAALLFTLRYVRPARRLAYACAVLILFACSAIGIAGCGGGSSGGGGPTVTPHTDSITAVYSGDGSYSGSTSAAVSVSIH